MSTELTAGRIAERLRGSGFQAYFVGGCVRDLLLGLTPKDYDIATDARPAQVLDLFPGSNLVGAHFGVVIVEGVEVATLRSEGSYLDGRRPESVHFERSPEADVRRRDFTINAMLLDPESGEVLDFMGGRADLDARLIRAIGDPDIRFAEDHLRLLRAVRFAARFDFRIEGATMNSIQRLASCIRKVSAERIRDEITRILTEGGARRGFELLEEAGLLREILPEVKAMQGVEQPPEYHPEGDVWTHTMMMLGNLEKGVPVTLALGVLLHDAGKPETFRIADRIRFDGHDKVGAEIARAICTRLRYSNEQTEQVVALVLNHMRFKDAPSMRESTLKRFLRVPCFDEHLELHRLDCQASHRNFCIYDYMRAKRDKVPPEVLRPDPLLSGRDLIAAGFAPGPMFSKVITAVEDAQLDGRIHTREEALALARALFLER